MLLWLILLIVISFSWSVIEDLLRATRSYFNLLFFRNTIFSIAYLIALYLGYPYDLLQQYWWVLAGAWVIMTVIDYRAHRAEFLDWSAVPRNLFYSVAGLIFLLTSYFFALPCTWWPFALIAVTSFGLFIIEKLNHPSQ